MPASKTRLEITPAAPADAAAITQLEQEIFGQEAWPLSGVTQELNAAHRSYYKLVDNAGAICGYAGALILPPEADVQTLAVATPYRGAGYGKQLLLQLAADAAQAGATQMFLEVRADNQPAQRLYQQLGFTQLAIRPKYYQPAGVDALIMAAPLPLRETPAHNQEKPRA